MSVLIDRILALDGETVCLGIGGKAAPAGVLMVAEYCEQYFYAQRVQIGYVPRIEGALYLRIEIQYRLPVGICVDVCGEDSIEAKILFCGTAIGVATRI